MTMLVRTLAAVAIVAGLALGALVEGPFTPCAFGQSAAEIRDASPFVLIETAPAPKLVVGPAASL